MSDMSGEVVAPDCLNLRQGDVVAFGELRLQSSDESCCGAVHTPHGIVVISQTCDLVQASKSRCLVAPVLEPTEEIVQDARKGRKPLYLYFEDIGAGNNPIVADLERIASVPKVSIIGQPLLARGSYHSSGLGVAEIASRIGRAFVRFPFPDEVYPVFKKLRANAQRRTGTESPLGRVLDLVLDIRISADQWMDERRRLVVWVLIPEDLIGAADDSDPSWRWGPERVQGCRQDERQGNLTLARICELILQNSNGDLASRDLSTLSILWATFGERLRTDLLIPDTNNAVTSIEVEVLSEADMTYKQFRTTESLDLEALSTFG